MSDPRRLLEDPAQLSEDELRLLTAGSELEPSTALGAEVWAGLVAKLPPQPAGAAPQSPSSGTAAPSPGGGVGGAPALSPASAAPSLPAPVVPSSLVADATEESEALSIEGLAQSGQSGAARARAQAFLENYAHSPYAARIRTLIGAI